MRFSGFFHHAGDISPFDLVGVVEVVHGEVEVTFVSDSSSVDGSDILRNEPGVVHVAGERPLSSVFLRGLLVADERQCFCDEVETVFVLSVDERLFDDVVVVDE